jgi:DNA-binding FrmR family transcriptional regulator
MHTGGEYYKKIQMSKLKTMKTASEKDPVLSKLRRVEGQVKGLEKMYEEQRGCLEMAQQIVAIRSALAGVAKDILTTEACKCAKEKNTNEDFDRVLKTLLDIY